MSDEARKARDEAARQQALAMRTLEARMVTNMVLDRMGAARALATPEERFAALDRLWQASTRLERKCMTEAMLAVLAGVTV